MSLLPTIQWGTLEESGIQENMLDSFRIVQQLFINEAVEGMNSIYGESHKVTAPVAGTLQEALESYEEDVLTEEAKNFDRHSKFVSLSNEFLISHW